MFFQVFALVSLIALPNGQTNQNNAAATLSGKSGSKVEGKVEFSKIPTGLKVSYELRNLPENKTLGFHIHEKGDCSSPDGKSAGNHYVKIGEPGTGSSKDFPEKYAGDLPSVTSDATGSARGTFTIPQISIDEKNPILDRAVIIHAGPDDVSKKSASRIACGVIRVVK
jgi:Cu-Zn family superoxide dismutase